jgi:hypothetical protein
LGNVECINMSPVKENTFRALKDEPLLATSKLCWLGFHKWTRLGEPVKAGTRYLSFGGWHNILVQEKRCVHCNKVSYKNTKVLKDD